MEDSDDEDNGDRKPSVEKLSLVGKAASNGHLDLGVDKERISLMNYIDTNDEITKPTLNGDSYRKIDDYDDDKKAS